MPAANLLRLDACACVVTSMQSSPTSRQRNCVATKATFCWACTISCGRMAPELFPSVPGAVSGMNRKEAEDRVTEKVGSRLRGALSAHDLQSLNLVTVPACQALRSGIPNSGGVGFVHAYFSVLLGHADVRAHNSRNVKVIRSVLACVLQVDVFSFGIVLWEIWTLGEQPYPNLSLQEIFAGVMTGTLRPAIPPGCDQDWVQLMQV